MHPNYIRVRAFERSYPLVDFTYLSCGLGMHRKIFYGHLKLSDSKCLGSKKAPKGPKTMNSELFISLMQEYSLFISLFAVLVTNCKM